MRSHNPKPLRKGKNMSSQITFLLRLHHQAIRRWIQNDASADCVDEHRKALQFLTEVIMDAGNSASSSPNPQELEVNTCAVSVFVPPPQSQMGTSVWNETFKIVDIRASPGEWSTYDRTIVTAVVLYNIAFAFHYQGLQSNSSELAEKALCLYSQVVGVLDSGQAEGEAASRLYLAILANCACIHTALQNATEASLLTAELQDMLCYEEHITFEAKNKLLTLIEALELTVRASSSAPAA